MLSLVGSAILLRMPTSAWEMRVATRIARMTKNRIRPCGSPLAKGCTTSTASCWPWPANICVNTPVMTPVTPSPAAPATMSFGPEDPMTSAPSMSRESIAARAASSLSYDVTSNAPVEDSCVAICGAAFTMPIGMS